jgi:hypothetical protein
LPRFFKEYIRGNFIRPYRITENSNLQNNLECLKTNDIDCEEEFTKFMDYIFNHYVKNNKYDKKLNEEDTKNFKNFMNVGINTININERTGQMKEIYVMIDLIEGQIDDSNKGQIKCTYFDQHLGNELNKLLFNLNLNNKYKNTKNWDITKNRIMFSVNGLLDNKDPKVDNSNGENRGNNMNQNPLPSNITNSALGSLGGLRGGSLLHEQEEQEEQEQNKELKKKNIFF